MASAIRNLLTWLLPPQKDEGSLELGTVGWDDGGSHYDTEAGEILLVKVTLFRGYRPGVDPQPREGRAGGRRLICTVSGPLNYIPPDGTRVMVAVPADCGWTQPGTAMILGCPAITPERQFGENRALWDFGEDFDLFIKAKSITLSDYEDRYVTVGPRFGIKAGDGDGCGFALKGGKWMFYAASGDPADAKAVLCLSTAKVQLSFKDSDGKTVSLVFSPGGQMDLHCKVFNCSAASGKLGGTASPASGVQYGPGMGLPSTSWKVAS